MASLNLRNRYAGEVRILTQAFKVSSHSTASHLPVENELRFWNLLILCGLEAMGPWDSPAQSAAFMTTTYHLCKGMTSCTYTLAMLKLSIFLAFLSFFFFFFKFMYLFWERAGRGGAEKEGKRGNPKQALHCQHSIVGLEPTNCEIMTWAKTRVDCLTDWATQVPLSGFSFLSGSKHSLSAVY